ncbi:hypothetical protein PCASD_09588 [Puccinia coronata f. sp. avenae]|uniref:Uncharacterized protein n=1 Tax=Puccinia coronata f. sp. avenae TaxID=200324 RepID=A0A2N5V2C2_9BASI|nr:hypothetical protein PCASD_09588 [Puccinia coronata f. sp. avenae]
MLKLTTPGFLTHQILDRRMQFANNFDYLTYLEMALSAKPSGSSAAQPANAWLVPPLHIPTKGAAS